MAFIDADEFVVLRSPLVPDLPALLADFEDFGGLAVNWQVRPAGSTYLGWTLAAVKLLNGL